MKTYWDYDEQERANLTDEQIRSLLDVELMTKGVKKPTPPMLVEVPKSPLGEKKKFFCVVGKGKYGSDEKMGAAFETIDKAQAFLELGPAIRDYDYEIGSEFEFFRPITDLKIQTEEFYSLEQINAFRVELKSRKAKTEANEKAQSAFNEATRKAEDITKGVWRDYYQMREKLGHLREIVLTFESYVTLASGDQTTAFKFLCKAYPRDEIVEAQAWFPGEITGDVQEHPEAPKEKDTVVAEDATF